MSVFRKYLGYDGVCFCFLICFVKYMYISFWINVRLTLLKSRLIGTLRLHLINDIIKLIFERECFV